MSRKAYIKDDFKNLLDYQEWVSTQMPEVLKRKNSYVSWITDNRVREILQSRPTWFGQGTTLEELKKGISTYKDPQLIDSIYNKIEDRLSTTIKNKIKAKKLNYNSMGLGVFSFDRAGMALYRISEFFSPSLNRVVEPGEVKKIKEYYVLVSDKSLVIKRAEQREDGKAKIRTHTKKVFAYFPAESKIRNAAEIFLSCGGNGSISAEDFLYSGITAVVIAELLIKARIKVKLNVVIGTSPSQRLDPYYGCIIPVKNYDEPLDRNVVALLSSDPRFYRYDGFKGILATTYYFAKEPMIHYGANGEELSQILEGSGYSKQNSQANFRFYFGRIFNESAAIKAISETITTISDHLRK